MAEPPPDPRGDAPDARARWLAENRAAMDAWNALVEREELPLARYRAW
jgi:post-segregation antitoxin (ccd killing protein)